MAGAQANIHTSFAPLTGSGRTAPALLQDLTLYDPHLRSPPGLNLLADGPINFGNAQYLYQLLHEASCRHLFLLQQRQTRVPNHDEQINETSVYQVAAVCQRCRIHLIVKVDFTAGWKRHPCPNTEHPVHHLIHSTYQDNLAHIELVKEDLQGSCEIFAYECSSSTCSAVVTVRLTPEVLSEEAVYTLTDPDLLRERTDEAFAARAGDTEGMRRPSATDVLTDLRTYLKNSWKTETKPEISLDNKRFAVRFGPGGEKCASVLENLGFVLKPGIAWQVPKPKPEETEIQKDPYNVFLDNVESELSVLILNRPDQERQYSQDNTSVPQASLALARVLGCQDYDRISTSRIASMDPSGRPAAFTILGVPSDASDELVFFAYEWQCAHHVRGVPRYLSALQSIAMQRSSEMLDVKCAVEQSNGRITHEQLTEAYQTLGLSMNIISDEDHIIGTFESRVSDARNQEAELRECLRVIGVGLNSSKVVDYATREISTYEQALAYLGLSNDTSDEFVQSMYGLKVSEHASQQEMASKAVKLIAMHRQSDALNAWIASNFTGEVQAQMDIGEAYQALGIQDRTTDDDLILTVYNLRKQEGGDSARLTRALTTIAQDRESPLLLSELQMSAPPVSRAPLTEPVGLDNIGNTCYLNSLLQFLFTIKVVRDIVLDFDRYKMELSPENMSVKKVGRRDVSRKEVETAQKFAVSLAGLFQTMITAPKTAIRPEQELARLTLETDQVKEKIRRRSTLGADMRPSLGSIDNREIQGPLPPSFSQMNGTSEEIPLLSPEAVSTTPDDTNPVDRLFSQSPVSDRHMDVDDGNSSEATLVSQPNSGANTPLESINVEQQQTIFDNKENLAPTKLESTTGRTAAAVEPLRPASPSKINAQAGAIARQNGAPEEQPIYQPPLGPPPVPPRKPVHNPTTTLEEYARQQDVTEVVGHCLFQLMCAMRPTGFQQNGEQQDEIHDLFFGECRTHTVPEKSTPDTPLPFLNVQAALINQPQDVYAALDNYFDISDAGNGRQGYISITKLPPILTITLGRVVWDSKANSQKKLDHHVQMPQTLYMDRYLESSLDSPLMRMREQSWGLKQELTNLAERKATLEKTYAESSDVPTLLDDARRCLEFLETEVSSDPKFGGPVQFDPELKHTLGRMANQKRDEMESTKSFITLRNEQLSNMFNGLQSHPYVLHAAFFHRGSHGSGHYWVYIRDHKTGIWRKYNDDHVTVVKNLAEIFDKPDTTGGWSGPANPYFLVYVREGQDTPTLDGLVETVKREPLHTNPDEEEEMFDLEPIGSGPAVARGLMSMTSGRVHSQMTEMPPDSVDREREGGKAPQNDGLSGMGGWAGEGVTAAGASGGNGVDDQKDWEYDDDRRDIRW